MTLNDEITWTSLAISHVEYPSGDHWGKLLAFLSLLPIMIASGFVTLVLFRRDLHTITFAVGTVLNEAANWILKHLIKEPRPCRGREILFSEYGMPSNHAQFIWFFASYLTLFLLFRLHHNSSSTILENLWKYLVVLVTMSVAVTVTYSRIYLQYHTWMQVAVGAGVGLTMAVLWFTITQAILTPLFPVIASWPLSQLLLLRDTTLIPNLMWFEYTSHRAEARTWQRKITSKSQ